VLALLFTRSHANKPAISQEEKWGRFERHIIIIEAGRGCTPTPIRIVFSGSGWCDAGTRIIILIIKLLTAFSSCVREEIVEIT
jgi:hypothetical protein